MGRAAFAMWAVRHAVATKTSSGATSKPPVASDGVECRAGSQRVTGQPLDVRANEVRLFVNGTERGELPERNIVPREPPDEVQRGVWAAGQPGHLERRQEERDATVGGTSTIGVLDGGPDRSGRVDRQTGRVSGSRTRGPRARTAGRRVAHRQRPASCWRLDRLTISMLRLVVPPGSRSAGSAAVRSPIASSTNVDAVVEGAPGEDRGSAASGTVGARGRIGEVLLDRCDRLGLVAQPTAPPSNSASRPATSSRSTKVPQASAS